jgi:hypothetical protein
LKREEKQSLGEWFFSECIAGFFQMIYKDKKDFTIFLTNFLQFGIAYIFIASIAAIK